MTATTVGQLRPYWKRPQITVGAHLPVIESNIFASDDSDPGCRGAKAPCGQRSTARHARRDCVLDLLILSREHRHCLQACILFRMLQVGIEPALAGVPHPGPSSKLSTLSRDRGDRRWRRRRRAG